MPETTTQTEPVNPAIAEPEVIEDDELTFDDTDVDLELDEDTEDGEE